MPEILMRMKKTIGIVFVGLIILSCNNASSKDSGSLLWKVSGNGLENPSYLFGTHHLIPISFLDNIEGIKEAVESTEQTIGEIDLTEMGQMQLKLMSEALLPEDITYESLLHKEDIVLLDSALHEWLGVGLDQLGHLKPSMLSNLISVTLYKKYYPNLSGEKSMDEYFQEEASKRFRPVKGLETVDEQIEILVNSQSLTRQAELLMCVVKHPDLLKEQMDKLQAAYYAYDLESIRKLYEEDNPDDPCPATPEEKDILNKKRNQQWLEKLPALMKEKPSFIAVGCAHLAGEDGLIEGLRKLGYKVEPVK
ncbi:MAG TPA: TraB/GumN family protein [Dysgonamonadaceae bacterium]|jgi:uncharacterized protein YbaP (TraB family)|nr:TraB/GumN family protein [Dysgonamonadaceae bacterium]